MPRSRVPFVCACVASILVFPPGAGAASGDADGAYTVTVTKIELSKDGGTSYATLFSGSQAINIAGVNAGALAAGLVSGVTLATGVYDIVRVTIGSTLQVKGYANANGNTYFTDGGTDLPDAFSITPGVLDAPGPAYATSTYTISVANRQSTSTGLAIRVEPGAAPTVRIAFDASGVLSVLGGLLIADAPAVSVTTQ